MAEDLVTIATFRFLNEAELARMYLNEEGVRSYIADGETVNMDWLLGNALGNIKLQVSSADVERALAAKEKWPKPRDRFEDQAAGVDTLRCLSCGKRMLEDQIECMECGWSYADAVDESAEADELRANNRDSKPRPRREPAAPVEEVETPDTRIQRDRPLPNSKRPNA
jgi:hypothetical protein